MVNIRKFVEQELRSANVDADNEENVLLAYYFLFYRETQPIVLDEICTAEKLLQLEETAREIILGSLREGLYSTYVQKHEFIKHVDNTYPKTEDEFRTMREDCRMEIAKAVHFLKNKDLMRKIYNIQSGK